jgi:hypothetical protein
LLVSITWIPGWALKHTSRHPSALMIAREPSALTSMSSFCECGSTTRPSATGEAGFVTS